MVDTVPPRVHGINLLDHADQQHATARGIDHCIDPEQEHTHQSARPG